MVSALTLSFVLAAAATTVAGLPTIRGRLCDILDVTPVALGTIEVWSAAGNLGYLTPTVSGTLGGGYGVISSNQNQALNGVFACGDPGNSRSPVTLGAENAQTVPGDTDDAAIGLIAPYYPDGGSPNVGSGSANWLAMGPTYVTTDTSRRGSAPNGTGIIFADEPAWFESNVWSTTGLILSGQSHVSLFPTWTNDDASGSTPLLYFAAIPDQGAIVVTGDYDAFTSAYDYVGNWVQVWLVIGPQACDGC
ncbi:hypothetical protein PsYK624_141980 [Phanerochaete sordida]|uniref:Uncharacterized protein n=1 Tax=Phanerochaete sordida TaxID=48140 RepID=A0A9P3LJY2_9APHY|nr:hypothetical protein PsYK624_141980 [Phanerochaete sordida]